MFKIDNAAARPAARLILAQAFQAARAYDGQEASYERLEANLIAFEKLVAAQGSGLARDKAEAAVSAALRRTHRRVTVQDLLDLAIRRFARRLEQDRVPIMVVETGFSFLPAQGEKPVKTGSGAGFTMPPTLERTRALIAALIENGIYVDDLIAYSGIAPPGHLRQQAYTLIQIPRCEREILVCDEFGQASFVGKGLRGPLFWATHRKDKLDAVPDIARVINREGALDQILSLILTDNPPRAKVKIARPYGFPLSEDIILRHALLYAASHEGELPTEDSGEVEGLPGQTWYAWTMALRQRGNGLTREGIKGLAHLFRLYGLKLRRKENPEVIKAALVNLAKTGKHELVVQEEFHLTEDVILYHALLYAASNDYNLPTQKTGEVKGLPGQNWKNWNSSLRRCLNGLTREGVKGLPHLFELYGLKRATIDDPKAITAAVERLTATGEHGLTVQSEFRLSEDIILHHAIAYAAAHDGKLPTVTSGTIEGMPGITWMSLNQMVRNCNHGLTREGAKGLSDLFNLYGLKRGQKEDPEAIAAAIKSIEETDAHGLTVKEKFHLSEDIILHHALLYAAAHKEGKLPTLYSGPVEGLPGQTWQNWYVALRVCGNGLTREGMTGLGHLFNLYGLKDGRNEIPEAIAAALEILHTSDNRAENFSLAAILARRAGLPIPTQAVA